MTPQEATISNYEVQERERHAHDWGRFDYQKELIKAIEAKMEALDEQDAAGHVYWFQFLELVKSIKP